VDLIILDIMMPGEDGLSFCQRLRETQDTPILMVSARSASTVRSGSRWAPTIICQNRSSGANWWRG
jgi:CheY-like chemotaxis protein